MQIDIKSLSDKPGDELMLKNFKFFRLELTKSITDFVIVSLGVHLTLRLFKFDSSLTESITFISVKLIISDNFNFWTHHINILFLIHAEYGSFWNRKIWIYFKMKIWANLHLKRSYWVHQYGKMKFLRQYFFLNLTSVLQLFRWNHCNLYTSIMV